MDSIVKAKEDIEKWTTTKSRNIKFIQQIENEFQFEIDSQKFKIIIPIDYPVCKEGFIVIDYDKIEPNFEWFMQLNNYICDEKPNLIRLLKHIECKYKEKKKENRRTIDINQLIDDEECILKFDIEELILRKNLEDNVKNMKSKLTSDIDSNKAPVLFTGNIPGNILINEFFNLRRIYRNSNKIVISLDNNNIYHWRLQFRNFSNNELKNDLRILVQKYNYDYIEINMFFHDKLYPSYPPFVHIVRPRMNKALMYRITNMKMLQFKYWSPCRTVQFVIEKLYEVLNNHGSIDLENEMNDINKYPEGSYCELELILAKLSSFCDIRDDEPLDTTDYPKIYNFFKQSNNKNDNKKTFWKPGTGYGHNGSSDWNLEEYIKLQKEKDIQIQLILQKIIDAVQNNQLKDMKFITKIVESSYLIPFIGSYLYETTLMEINKHKNIYRLIFTLLQNFVKDETISIFVNNLCQNGKSLFDLLTEINKEVEQLSKLTHKIESNKKEDISCPLENNFDNEVSQMIKTLYEMVLPCYHSYMDRLQKFKEEKQKREKKIDDNKNIIHEQNEQNKLYKNEMEPLKFDMGTFIKNGFHHKITTDTNSNITRRLAEEFSILMKSLPIFYQSSIFVRVDEENIRCIRVMITGPEDTPYDSGVFFFDVYITEEYPNKPPQTIFINHSGKRFNPNLYSCGKVCLSLLGTWNGYGGEKWNKDTSTLHQLFVSIQSQIFNETPFFNEPGWESYYGTDYGNNMNKQYNNYVRYYTMCHAMYDILVEPSIYTEFRTVINKHFSIKKDYILNICKKWVDEAQNLNKGPQQNESINKSMYETKYNQLKELLSKL